MILLLIIVIIVLTVIYTFLRLNNILIKKIEEFCIK